MNRLKTQLEKELSEMKANEKILGELPAPRTKTVNLLYLPVALIAAVALGAIGIFSFSNQSPPDGISVFSENETEQTAQISPQVPPPDGAAETSNGTFYFTEGECELDLEARGLIVRTRSNDGNSEYTPPEYQGPCVIEKVNNFVAGGILTHIELMENGIILGDEEWPVYAATVCFGDFETDLYVWAHSGQILSSLCMDECECCFLVTKEEAIEIALGIASEARIVSIGKSEIEQYLADVIISFPVWIAEVWNGEWHEETVREFIIFEWTGKIIGVSTTTNN
jgi:hypothetical protein